jgi:hypothetical protein
MYIGYICVKKNRIRDPTFQEAKVLFPLCQLINNYNNNNNTALLLVVIDWFIIIIIRIEFILSEHVDIGCLLLLLARFRPIRSVPWLHKLITPNS